MNDKKLLTINLNVPNSQVAFPLRPNDNLDSLYTKQEEDDNNDGKHSTISATSCTIKQEPNEKLLSETSSSPPIKLKISKKLLSQESKPKKRKRKSCSLDKEMAKGNCL